MGSIKGNVAEAFVSVQGEGLFAGEIHAFLRLGGCPLRCVYCDTPQALEKKEKAVLHYPSGQIILKNPLSPEDVARFFKVWAERTLLEKLCITGGEPLLQPEFSIAVAKEVNLPVLYETSGTPSDNLYAILKQGFLFALDVKLPYSSGVQNGFELFEKALRILKGEYVFIKAVVRSGESDLENAAELVKGILGENVNFFIQPAEKIDILELMKFYASVRNHLNSVRILPQLHKQLGVK